ncbi:trypsin-like peptidase domain-containing protein [Thiotrichales bacterium HSG1]|nr:trypsin-like peptidase domain-containing protein [Thiotrichales bacterium HSG1]
MENNNSRKKIIQILEQITVKIKVGFRPENFRGTGFFITNDGYILTAWHCIQDAVISDSAIIIECQNGETYRAEIKQIKIIEDLKKIGLDIVILKIEYRVKICVPLGKYYENNKGDEIVSLGYPASHLNNAGIRQYFGKISGIINDNTIELDGGVKGEGQSGSLIYSFAAKRIIGLVIEKYNTEVMQHAGLAINFNYLLNTYDWKKFRERKIYGIFLGFYYSDIESKWDSYLKRIEEKSKNEHVIIKEKIVVQPPYKEVKGCLYAITTSVLNFFKKLLLLVVLVILGFYFLQFLEEKHNNELKLIKNKYEKILKKKLELVKDDYDRELSSIRNSYNKKVNEKNTELETANLEYYKNLATIYIKYDEIDEQKKLLDNQIQELEKNIKTHEKQLEEKNEKLKEYKNYHLPKLEGEIDSQKSEINELEEKIKLQESLIYELDSKIVLLNENFLSQNMPQAIYILTSLNTITKYINDSYISDKINFLNDALISELKVNIQEYNFVYEIYKRSKNNIKFISQAEFLYNFNKIENVQLSSKNNIIYVKDLKNKSIKNQYELHLWDTNNFEKIRTIKENANGLFGVITPDEKKIITTSYAGKIKIQNIFLKNDKLINKPSHKKAAYHIEISSDSKKIITASQDKHAVLWNIKTGNKLCTFPHKGLVKYAQFNSDDSKIITASYDKKVRIWDVKTCTKNNNIPNNIIPHKNKVIKATFTSYDDRIVTIDKNDELNVWYKQGKEHKTDKPFNNVKKVKVSLDKKIAMLQEKENKYNVVILATNSSGIIFRKTDLIETYDISFSPNGKLIAFPIKTEKNYVIQVWNIEQNKLITEKDLTEKIKHIQFSSNGKKFLAASDNKIILWDIEIKEFELNDSEKEKISNLYREVQRKAITQ